MLNLAPDNLAPLPKSLTGISGFDEITFGGLPTGRPTLICGGAGAGKTLFATTFLINGAIEFGEPGVFMSFDERAVDLAANVASLGYDVAGLRAAGKIVIDHVQCNQGTTEEAGEYNLEGLFARLGHAVDTVGAKRIVLDRLEALFSGLSDVAMLRTELYRLFGWIKERGLTAVITAERGDGQLTRQGLEEYVSDCVVLLDNRVQEQISTRRLRIAKYRGSAHGTNEYPFLIDANGITVIPVTGAVLTHGVSSQVVRSGILGLDAMLGKGGFYRGSSVLITGMAGAGKTTMGAIFADAACRRGESCLFCVFEESAVQICRNASSVGLDLQQHVDSGRLVFQAARPTLYGLETHLARMYRDLDTFVPDVMVIDPISALRGPSVEVYATVLRMVDMLKSRGITGLFTSLRTMEDVEGLADQELSSLMDICIRLVGVEENGEMNRTLYVIKARGMGHSNQVREYQVTDNGIMLIEPYIGPEGVLTGTARTTQVAFGHATHLRHRLDAERRQRELQRRRQLMEHEITEMRAAAEAEEEDVRTLLSEDSARAAIVEGDRVVNVGRRSAAGLNATQQALDAVVSVREQRLERRHRSIVP